MYEELNGNKPTSYLELGCGPLRHGIELASGERPVSVVGLDNSPCMLQYAQEQVAEELSAEQAARVSVMNADMRRFQIRESVDMAYSLHGTFGHLLEHAEALSSL